jgi:hypothetical protein
MKVDLTKLKDIPERTWTIAASELLIAFFAYKVIDNMNAIMNYLGDDFANYMIEVGDLTQEHIRKLSELFQLPESTWRA